jgi:hypothetical protein
MRRTNCDGADVPKSIVDEIKKTYVFRDANVYNKKTGRQLKRYEYAGLPVVFLLIHPPEKYGFALYFKLKGRVIDFKWAKENLTYIIPSSSSGISTTSL